MNSAPSDIVQKEEESTMPPKAALVVTALEKPPVSTDAVSFDMVQDTPRPDKKSNGQDVDDVSSLPAKFGNYCHSRSTSDYSTMSSSDLSWNGSQPSSSPRAYQNMGFRSEEDMSSGHASTDAGYASQSPTTTVFLRKTRTFDVAKAVEFEAPKAKSEEKPVEPVAKAVEQMQEVEVVHHIKTEKPAAGGVEQPPEKAVRNRKQMTVKVNGKEEVYPPVDVPKDVPEKVKERKQRRERVRRPENEKVDPPNAFAGMEYGCVLAEMASRGTNGVFAFYERNPSKFYKRHQEPLVCRIMPLLFGKSHKTPADVVKSLREVLIILDKLPAPRRDRDGNVVTDKKYDKALEEVSKHVAQIKSFIYGSDAPDTNSDHVVQVAQLAQEVYNANILPMLIKMLPKFEFECKKDVGQIFNNLLRRQIGTRSPTVEYLGARPEILIQLVQGYSSKEIALVCGLMLRECIRHDHLAKIILTSDVFYTFFTYVQSEVFDISSDAFSTFKDLTTKHKTVCAEFLDANYDTFFAQYQNLLLSNNYVTRRQSLKLLGELLLDRHNFNIMNKYISNPENMRLMMELLRDKSRNIQYEAFHVFKVFVANPNKPKPISDILLRNREKLVEFLGEFHNDRTDDEQFNDEKAYLIKQIQEMKGSPKESKKMKPKEEGDLAAHVEGLSVSPVPSSSQPSTSQQPK